MCSGSVSAPISITELNEPVLDLGPDKVAARFEYEQADDEDKEIPHKASPFLESETRAQEATQYICDSQRNCQVPPNVALTSKQYKSG